jgi:hypothetical protein
LGRSAAAAAAAAAAATTTAAPTTAAPTTTAAALAEGGVRAEHEPNADQESPHRDTSGCQHGAPRNGQKISVIRVISVRPDPQHQAFSIFIMGWRLGALQGYFD